MLVSYATSASTVSSLFVKRPELGAYAAFFSPDNAPRIFFIHAENRWRFCSRRTTASLVTQLN